jgi:hypothetical protein
VRSSQTAATPAIRSASTMPPTAARTSRGTPAVAAVDGRGRTNLPRTPSRDRGTRCAAGETARQMRTGRPRVWLQAAASTPSPARWKRADHHRPAASCQSASSRLARAGFGQRLRRGTAFSRRQHPGPVARVPVDHTAVVSDRDPGPAGNGETADGAASGAARTRAGS